MIAGGGVSCILGGLLAYFTTDEKGCVNQIAGEISEARILMSETTNNSFGYNDPRFMPDQSQHDEHKKEKKLEEKTYVPLDSPLAQKKDREEPEILTSEQFSTTAAEASVVS